MEKFITLARIHYNDAETAPTRAGLVSELLNESGGADLFYSDAAAARIDYIDGRNQYEGVDAWRVGPRQWCGAGLFLEYIKVPAEEYEKRAAEDLAATYWELNDGWNDEIVAYYIDGNNYDGGGKNA